MAFPAVESSQPTNGSTAATSHAVTLPATISNGALLMVAGRVTVAGAVAVTGGGWTITQDSSDASDDVSFWMYRDTVADGTEDGSTITVTHGSGKLAAISYSITGAPAPGTRSPESSTVAVGTGSNPGPTACTPTGGAKDYLWIAVGMADGEHTSPPATIPANYGSSVGANTASASTPGTNARVYSATRNLNAASEDPGTWTTDVAVNAGWTAWTLAVHPAVSVPHTVDPADGVAAAETLSPSRGISLSIQDTAGSGDALGRQADMARALADLVAAADVADPQLAADEPTFIRVIEMVL